MPAVQKLNCRLAITTGPLNHAYRVNSVHILFKKIFFMALLFTKLFFTEIFYIQMKLTTFAELN
jgi:hypothetical protein